MERAETTDGRTDGRDGKGREGPGANFHLFLLFLHVFSSKWVFKVVIMTVSWSINTLAVAKLVPLRPGLERCDEQEETPGSQSLSHQHAFAIGVRILNVARPFRKLRSKDTGSWRDQHIAGIVWRALFYAVLQDPHDHAMCKACLCSCEGWTESKTSLANLSSRSRASSLAK